MHVVAARLGHADPSALGDSPASLKPLSGLSGWQWDAQSVPCLILAVSCPGNRAVRSQQRLAARSARMILAPRLPRFRTATGDRNAASKSPGDLAATIRPEGTVRNAAGNL
jgi:hypothetical protein